VSNTASKRPDHLPDFIQPPLNEVALGVQFATPTGYQQILAGEVWNLFRKEYPQVQEQAPIAPAFETFGLPTPSGQLSFVTGASHDRFWFLREEGDELIQFQNDRLLHNWRKIAGGGNEYPRFEHMIGKFDDELKRFQNYINGLAPQTLNVNQCEVSYINHIVAPPEQDLMASKWLRFVSFGGSNPDDFKVGFREIIRDEAGKPQGRLIGEAVSALDQGGQQIIAFTITVRGAPKEPKIESALNFISKGRELIVSRFTELTTDYAHTIWRRRK
jgi:uncharacterized protein (TIGR04255 family)